VIKIGDTVMLTGTMKVTKIEETTIGKRLIYGGLHEYKEGDHEYIVVPAECVDELQPQTETLTLTEEEADDRHRHQQ